MTLKVTAGTDDFIRIDGPSSAMVIKASRLAWKPQPRRLPFEPGAQVLAESWFL